MQYKILVVDDDRDICCMLKDYLGILGYLVYIANSSEAALERLGVIPDLILLDINMPKMDGISFCKKIRGLVNCPIVFLTARVEEQDRVNGLMAGGDDYITKPFSLDELQARIVAHIRREERGRAPKHIKTVGNIVIDYDLRAVRADKNDIGLTKTEFDILELLSENEGRTFDKETIYERLWGFDKDGDSQIITEHIRRIRMKLKKQDGEELIETVWGVGYRWKKS